MPSSQKRIQQVSFVAQSWHLLVLEKFGPMLLLNLLYWLQLICVVISSSSDEKSSDDLTSAALTRW
ncbi:hypothetical protein AO250_18730 [Pseudomonas syringae pv. actinidiae ICMP 19497]|nr:hypothetical protein AO250_18730 [Pseudomonas syringae pv. actinidiae ICMP 19497]OKS76113.1 hypothetical protein PsaNZ64_08575 [Pseudomonas syringae pv. actinidiae]